MNTSERVAAMAAKVAALLPKVAKLTADRAVLLAVCKVFVARVERGEVRSVVTYAAMKAAIEQAEGGINGNGADGDGGSGGPPGVY